MTNLKIFDFDSTLVLKPTIYEWGVSEDEEDSGYMETKKSLEYDFQLNDLVLAEYKKAKRCNKTIILLLTNRTYKLEKDLLDLLIDMDIYIDIPLFRKNDRSKGNRLKKLLNEIPKIKNVEYYEDKDKHLFDVYNISGEFPDINFRLNKVFPDKIVEFVLFDNNGFSE